MKVGFDIGGTNIKAGVVDEAGTLVTKRNVPFPKNQGYEKTIDCLEALVYDMLGELALSPVHLKAIGIAVPGSIDPKGEMVIDAHNLGFHNVPLKAAVSKRFPNTPVFIANDADAATLAELHAGAFAGCKTAVLLTLGTGLGGGIILDGKMFSGGLRHGVELGHMILIDGGLPCSCGNRGCAETVCTATWLTRQGREVLEQGKTSLIGKKTQGNIDKVNAKTVLDSAKEGDPEAVRIFHQYVDYLSSAISSITTLLDPEVVALGGGVSLAGDFLFEAVADQVEKKSFFKYRYKIVPAVMGNDAGIFGAAMLLHN